MTAERHDVDREQIVGEWWLPETPERRKVGHLGASSERWVLTVDGGLETPTSTLPDGPAHIDIRGEFRKQPVIHGRARDGVHHSLFDCEGYSFFGDLPIQPSRQPWRFSSRAVGRRHVTPDDQVGTLVLQLGSLDQWGGREVQLQRSGSEDGRRRLDIPRDSVETCRLNGGASLALGPAHGVQADLVTTTIRSGAQLTLSDLDGLTIGEAYGKWVLPLRRMMCFLSLGYVPIERVDIAVPGETEGPDILRLHAHLKEPTDDKGPVYGHEMLLTRGALAERGVDLGEIVVRWFKLEEELGAVIGMLLFPDLSSSNYSDDRLLTAFKAVEGYHGIRIGGTSLPEDEYRDTVAKILAALPEGELRDWTGEKLRDRNQKGQRKRLSEVLERAGQTGSEVAASYPKFIEAVNRSRQKVVHPGPAGEHDGVRLHAGAIGLRWVLRHLLLAELLDGEAADAIISQHARFAQDCSNMVLWAEDL